MGHWRHIWKESAYVAVTSFCSISQIGHVQSCHAVSFLTETKRLSLGRLCKSLRVLFACYWPANISAPKDWSVLCLNSSTSADIWTLWVAMSHHTSFYENIDDQPREADWVGNCNLDLKVLKTEAPCLYICTRERPHVSYFMEKNVSRLHLFNNFYGGGAFLCKESTVQIGYTWALII